MKTIGYVLADFPVFSETFVGNEMRAVMEHGHRVAPIVLRPASGTAHEADRLLADAAPKMADISRADVSKTFAKPGRRALDAMAFAMRQTRLSKRSLIWNGLRIATLARQHGCQHLHAHFAGGATAHAIFAARWLGVSVSFVCHGHDVYAEPEDLRLKLETADAVVAVCGDMANDLRREGPGSRVVTITCGTDPDIFTPSRMYTDIARFLFIGRLVEQKGIDDLLDALAMHGSAAIDIVGSGPLRDAYMRRVDELGLGDRVRFLGDRSRDWIQVEAPRYLGLIAPFKPAPDGARDSGPLVVKEAMAMGLPVVATRFMGNKEMVSAETGFLVNVADPADLAAAFNHLLAMSPDERHQMGMHGRERVVDRFSLKAQARSLSALFEAA
jgi:colanic acid/amylovoran biosynthesis glycosyltransferase